MSRRSVLARFAAAGLTQAFAPPAAMAAEGSLIALGVELHHLRRRCGRLRAAVHRLSVLAERTASERGIVPWLADHRRNPAIDALRDELGLPIVWRRWSAALDLSLALVHRISSTPARDVADLAVKHEGLMWLLTHDDDLFDRTHRTALIGFGHELRSLSGA